MLFLTPRFPYPIDRGDRIRSYNLIREFSRHADVTLATFRDAPIEAAHARELDRWCRHVETVYLPKRRSQLNMLMAAPERVPFQVAYYRSAAMERLVDRFARESYDLVFGHFFRMVPYLERLAGPPCVLDLCDSLAVTLERAIPVKPWYSRFAFRQEQARVFGYERYAMGVVRESWVATSLDRADLLLRAPSARIEVVPIGIEGRWGTAGLDGPKEDAALFLGNLTVGHNVDAATYLAEDIWPRVRRARPEARLYLVGRANRATERLGALAGVTVVGFVPDLSSILSRVRLSVAPIRYGAGIQTKILETMAAGLPAVVSSIAAAPIEAEPGAEILVATSAVEMSDEIVRLLSDEATARRIGEAGSRFVRSRFSWARAGERMRELLS
jgi:glycosyltransferase involved in cell wall biosynthesis